MKLPLKKIRCNGGTQPRAMIHENVITEYAEAMREGTVFPPLTVFHDGKDYWLADGFHRLGAALELDLATIECDVRQGTLEDAQWFSFSVNQSHGLRRTNDDKARAVKASLCHCKGKRSNIEIARHVGVSDRMVSKYRTELEETGELQPLDHEPGGASPKVSEMRDAEAPGQAARVVNRKGKTYQMKVGQIGTVQKSNRRKFGGIAKNAYQPTRPVALPSEMLSISLPIDNPHMAAKGMLSRYERTFLVALVKELTTLLKEGN